MKVLLLTDGIYPFVIGGMQKHSFNLAKWLTLSEVKVTLVHCVSQPAEIPTAEEVNKALFNGSAELEAVYGFKFPEKGIFPGHYIRNSHKYSALIYERLKTELNNFDLIYAQGYTGWVALENKHRINTPIYVNFHGLNMFQPSFGIKASSESLMLRESVKKNIKKADVNISLGGKLTKIIEKRNVQSPVLISYNGVDQNWLIKSSEIEETTSAIKFVFIGRYDKIKGLHELNMAINQLAENQAFEMHFIGAIPDANKVKLASVTYHGEIKGESEIQSILDNCDVLICPSYSEGMPTVVLEAMARGLAIIATDVGAVSEQVGESNGWLIEAGSIADLKTAMLEAIADKKMIQKKIKSIEIQEFFLVV